MELWIELTRYIPINDRELRVTAEYYRTDFLKQTIVDIDSDVREVRFYDLIWKIFFEQLSARNGISVN